jgi:protein Tex
MVMGDGRVEVHVGLIASELGVRPGQVRAVVVLLDDGATMPFIARYRKEATGELDEVAVGRVRDRIGQLRELDERREAMVESLTERGLLTPELSAQLEDAPSMARLEDVYLPYRPKRRTRAMIARERELEPLAEILWAQDQGDVQAMAATCVDPELGVPDVEAALAGARDIIAEWISEDEWARSTAREMFSRRGLLRSQVAKGKEEEGAKFRDYFDAQELAANTPSHRVLAVFRGEQEGMLSVQVAPEEAEVVETLASHYVTGAGEASGEVETALEDGYKRLLGPSMETETRNGLKERADATAIAVFAENLRKLLLAAPLGQKAMLAIDPGFRTGCKVVVLDKQGALLHSDTVYLHLGAEREANEAKKLVEMVDRYKVEAIAIGNGTAGRETEAVVRNLKFRRPASIVMVNESGASVYSASAVAREEFPDHDLTVRGAVSIGRRLMDPLAELVKIEPKAIGVGQYQHDVDQNALAQRLHDVVVSCVNLVGVDLNTASPKLLAFVSGLGPSLAKSIVQYRDTKGAFKSRDDLLQVPRLGPKAFEQAAGFLRIRDAANPLDASGVHPESYGVVRQMAHDLGCDVAQLMRDEDARELVDIQDYVTDAVGVPTLNDIMGELAKPGRDPREAFEAFAFSDEVHAIEDLRTGMELPGVVTNVTAFGAFVDVGAHGDGLVHISKLANRFVSDPNEVVSVGQQVVVTVLEIDLERKRVSLSLVGS